jgi:hypothetical protein
MVDAIAYVNPVNNLDFVGADFDLVDGEDIWIEKYVYVRNR